MIIANETRNRELIRKRCIKADGDRNRGGWDDKGKPVGSGDE